MGWYQRRENEIVDLQSVRLISFASYSIVFSLFTSLLPNQHAKVQERNTGKKLHFLVEEIRD